MLYGHINASNKGIFYDTYTAYVFIIHWGNLLKFVNFLLGLVADCNNITITASEYLTNPSTIVDVGGKCAKTNSDAVDGVVVYGSASEIFSNCSGEVVNNNIVLTFRFHFDDSIQIQTKADEFLIQCEVSTQTLLNSTLDYQLEPYFRTSGHASGKGNFMNFRRFWKICRAFETYYQSYFVNIYLYF